MYFDVFEIIERSSFMKTTISEECFALLSTEDEKKYEFLISVIMPIYNTEEYLRDAITSILDQSIGFEENIQLILVNNGSTDDCDNICAEYEKKHPKNVKYIKVKRNIGPSGGRNVGKQYAKGKYVNFFDADDMWNDNSFELLIKYLEINKEIDFCVGRMKFFDNSTQYHTLDYRFRKTQIINIYYQSNFLQLHVTNVIFRYEKILDYLFNEDIYHAEDTLYILPIMLNNNKYGVVRNAVYKYRKHSHNTISLLEENKKKRDYYTNQLTDQIDGILHICRQKCGKITRYVETLIWYSLRWRLFEEIQTALTSQELNHYTEIMRSYLEYVDDQIIADEFGLNAKEKIKTYSLKYNKNCKSDIICKGNRFLYNNICVFSEKSTNLLKITNVDIKNNRVQIQGKLNIPLNQEDYLFIITSNNVEYSCSKYEVDFTSESHCLGYCYHKEQGFEVDIALDEFGLNNIEFAIIYDNNTMKLKISHQFVSPLVNEMKNSFSVKSKYILERTSSSISIRPYSIVRHLKDELKYQKELLKLSDKNIINWRLCIIFTKLLKKVYPREIWLMVDFFSTAQDNAEALYLYVLQEKNKKICPIFVVSKTSPDYKRLKKLGNVVAYDTKLYRLLFAISDKLITSQTFYSKRNTFFHRTTYLKDLFNFKYIYLQHGIIKDNHANTLACYKTDIDILITSSKEEWLSLLSGEYHYTSEVVKLTGIGRHDAIVNLEKNSNRKMILLAPTWRKDASGKWDEKTQSYNYDKMFMSTDFFKFFNSLITDGRVLSKLEEKDFYISVQLHPRIAAQCKDFTESERVFLVQGKVNMLRQMSETVALITDYSSIAFDYVYAGIPILYTQFDKEKFYSNHAYTRGYFDFETHGFGSVCYDYETTVAELLNMMENSCIMQEKYEKRRKSFFEYFDGKNCERIYQEILKLDEEKTHE